MTIGGTLAAMRRRAGEATKGPWRYGIRHDGTMWMSMGDPAKGAHVQADWEFDLHNADFCAQARTDLPRLVAALEIAVEALEGHRLDTPFWRARKLRAREEIAAALEGHDARVS